MSEFDQYDKTRRTSTSFNCLPIPACYTITTLLYSIYKTCYRLFTGKSQVERILQNLCTTSLSAQGVYGFELFKCLAGSKNETLQRVARFLDGENCDDNDLDHKACANIIIRTKVKSDNLKLAKNLESKLLQISNFGHFRNVVMSKQKQRYSSDCEEHEQMLLKLWKNAGTGELSSRKSKQWQLLGFQGDDPATDFRGMGILSLWCMVRYTDMNPNESRSFISKSNHPKTGYPYALVCLNACALLIELIQAGNIYLRQTLYKIDREDLRSGDACLELFGDLHTKIVYELVRAWDIKQPTDIMKFAEIRTRFKAKLERNFDEFLTD